MSFWLTCWCDIHTSEGHLQHFLKDVTKDCSLTTCIDKPCLIWTELFIPQQNGPLAPMFSSSRADRLLVTDMDLGLSGLVMKHICHVLSRLSRVSERLEIRPSVFSEVNMRCGRGTCWEMCVQTQERWCFIIRDVFTEENCRISRVSQERERERITYKD